MASRARNPYPAGRIVTLQIAGASAMTSNGTCPGAAWPEAPPTSSVCVSEPDSSMMRASHGASTTRSVRTRGKQ